MCASILEQKSEHSWWCPVCRYTQYENPKPAAEIAVLRDDKVLISKRGIEPRKGQYDLPGGFIEYTETAEQAILREMREELSIRPSDITSLSYLRSFNATYPFGNEVYRVLVVVFAAQLKDGAKVIAQDDVAKVEWVTKSQLDLVDWALPEHKENAIAALNSTI